MLHLLSVLLGITGGMPYQPEVSNHQAGIEYCVISLCFTVFLYYLVLTAICVALGLALSWIRLFCHDVLYGFALSSSTFDAIAENHLRFTVVAELENPPLRLRS